MQIYRTKCMYKHIISIIQESNGVGIQESNGVGKYFFRFYFVSVYVYNRSYLYSDNV